MKYYVEEGSSPRVVGAVRDHAIAISRLSMVEVGSALARRRRAGDLDAAARDRLLAALQEDEPAFRVVELTPVVVTEAQRLLRTHVLRAGDAVQLASLLVLGRALGDSVSLLAFDDALIAAADAEGVPLLE